MSKSMTAQQVGQNMHRYSNEVDKVLVGGERTTAIVLRTMLARGHCLVQGVPGVGKSLLAKALARSLDVRSTVFQFYADTMPSDVTGTEIYDPVSRTMKPKKGLIDWETPFVLADEINRAPEKTLGSLLTIMQDAYIRIGETDFPMAQPFFAIGCCNPIEQGGTYKLPEAVLDRFYSMAVMGYTTFDQAVHMAMDNNHQTVDPITSAGVHAVLHPEELLAMQEFVRENIKVSQSVARYIARLIFSTRPAEDDDSTDTAFDGRFYNLYMPEAYRKEKLVLVGDSNRAIIYLTAMAKANAAMDGRNEVQDSDVKDVATSVLAHRLTLNAQKAFRYDRNINRKIVRELLKTVPTVG